MKITTRTFLIGTVLILLIPVFYNINLISNGERIKGTVTHFQKKYSRKGGSYQYPVIQYQVNNTTYALFGPQNFPYDIDQELTVLYDKNDPWDSMLLNIEGIYLGYISVIPVFLLIIWAALYRAFKPKKYSRPLPGRR